MTSKVKTVSKKAPHPTKSVGCGALGLDALTANQHMQKAVLTPVNQLALIGAGVGTAEPLALAAASC